MTMQSQPQSQNRDQKTKKEGRRDKFELLHISCAEWGSHPLDFGHGPGIGIPPRPAEKK